MNAEILLPALVAGVSGVLATAGHRRLRPDAGAWLLTLTLVAVVVAVVPAVVVLAFGYLTHLPWFDGAMSWCRKALGMHQPLPWWLGLASVVAVAAGIVRVRGVQRTWCRFRCRHSSGIEVATSDELFAYTMPGAGGHIVISSALCDRLDGRQLDVVLAHERAHARHRHDRFVLVGSVAVALVPPLLPLQHRQRFALERWADEEAVDELGIDRGVVARTLASVALSSVAVPDGAVGLAGLGVPGRVVALLDPPSTGRTPAVMALGAVGLTAIVGAAAVQAHHVLPLLASLCPG